MAGKPLSWWGPVGNSHVTRTLLLEPGQHLGFPARGGDRVNKMLLHGERARDNASQTYWNAFKPPSLVQGFCGFPQHHSCTQFLSCPLPSQAPVQPDSRRKFWLGSSVLLHCSLRYGVKNPALILSRVQVPKVCCLPGHLPASLNLGFSSYKIELAYRISLAGLF